MTSRLHGVGTVFQETRPGAGFGTGDFVEEKLGGGWCRRTTNQEPHHKEMSSPGDRRSMCVGERREPGLSLRLVTRHKLA